MSKYLSGISYVIKPGETLASIREKFPYIPSWKYLADYNDLEYPYIVASPEDKEQKATGQVEFTLIDNQQPYVIIPKFTIVGFYDNAGNFISYYTLNEITLYPSDASKTTMVTALNSGKEYNINPNIINIINHPTLPQLVKVTNITPISGGFKNKVVSYGDIIYIPHSSNPQQKIVISYEEMYGSDIFAYTNLSPDFGKIEISSDGDLKLVKGLANLEQALIRRIITGVYELPKHPDYGSNLKNMIGKAIAYNIPQMIGYEIIRTLKQDPRVTEVKDVKIQIIGEAANVSCQVIIDNAFTLPLELEVS
jgi:phage baseplate assembly protein W